jgi:RHS repeat-associated protein
LPINKSGYLYVYVSNETPNINVFFDNLQVTHVKGPLVEETHYYPWGLTMAGISSKVMEGNIYSSNKKEFNGIEHTTDLELNHYDAFYRTLDPQIGSFLQIDPKIARAEGWSPYSAMLNNPIFHADPLGDSAIKPLTPE